MTMKPDELHPLEHRLFHRQGVVPDYYISPSIRVRSIQGKGLGVVAIESIQVSEVIECCPVKILTSDNSLDERWRRLHRTMFETLFSDHYFWWTPRYGALALGYGSLYNHSPEPNAEIFKLKRHRKMVFAANQNIAPGSEITICYRCVWFDIVDGNEAQPLDPIGGAV